MDVSEQELRNIQWDAALLGMFLPFVTAVIIVLTALVPYVIYKQKEAADRKLARKQHWVELLQRFTNDLYGNAAVVDLFLEIQQAVLDQSASAERFPSLGIQPNTVPKKEPVLARLLETINLVGLMIRLEMVSPRDVARSSIAYVALILWEHDEVREYVEHLSKQHARLNHPEDAFPEIESLVSELKKEKVRGRVASAEVTSVR